MQFQSTGYESGELMENMGTLWIICHSFVILLLLMLGMFFIRGVSDRAHIWYAKIRKMLMWNPILLFLTEGYLEMALCSSAALYMEYIPREDPTEVDPN